MGKAKQAAKTEMEKIKMQDMTCRELIKEAAKMWVTFWPPPCWSIVDLCLCCCSIYVVHDEVKDKQFELELSWVGQVTQGRHQKVPDDVFAEADRYAKSALEEDSDSGNEDMWTYNVSNGSQD